MSTAGRVGVFLCQGGRGTADSLEFKQLRWAAEATSDAVFTVAQSCQAEGAAAIARRIKELGLSAALVGACPLLHHPGSLSRALAAEGLDPEMATVLDLCAKPEGQASGACAVAPGASAALDQALCGLEFSPALALEEMPVSTRVLVVGAGLAALLAAREMLNAGYQVALLSPGKRLAPPEPLLGPEAAARAAELAHGLEEAEGLSLFRQGRLLSLSGTAGQFRARIQDRGGESHQVELGGVVVAQGPPQALNLPPGIAPGERVVSLSELVGLSAAPEHLKKRLGEGPLKVALAVGLAKQSDPLTLRAAVQAAMELAGNPANRVVLFTGNAKVAGPGLEALTQEARAQSVVMVKFTQGGLRAAEGGARLALEWDEEILGRVMADEFDLLAVDQVSVPDAAYAALAHTLGLGVGRDGSLQPEGVGALPVASGRGGVWLVGPARGQGEPGRWADEAAEAARQARELLGQGEPLAQTGRVSVDRKRCTICLTCVRVCPQGAMDRLHRRPLSNPLVCTACGTCAAECPMEAIQIAGLEDQRYEREIGAAGGRSSGLGPATERGLLVLACANSAAPALHAARLSGAALPSGARVVRVPCAGKVDLDMVLEGLRRGFDGVLMLACHPDACQSLGGNTWAARRWEHLGNLLAESGLGAERLFRAGVAPSQAREAMRAVERAAEALGELGPSPLKTSARVREMLGRFTLEMDDTFAIVS
ncbi:MAG: hydrogenase iron-sulfur subunit [Desulfarculaceae bacterium]|nr:hydrogenase iron-sulfur subunit [Desulfarculaceae bacterium]